MEPLIEEPDAFVVRFSRLMLWRLRGLCLLGLLLCGAAFGLASGAEASGTGIVLRPLALALMPIGIVACLILFGVTFVWMRRPAFVAGADGIVIGFKFRKPFLVPWQDIKQVVRANYREKEDALGFIFENGANVERYFSGLWMPTDLATGLPVLTVGLALLDASLEEIGEGLSAVRPMGEDERQAWLDLSGKLQTAFQGRLTHDGDLITVEDYRRVFRRSPLGGWSDSVYGVSPADSSVGFCRDGTGWAGHGASQMFGYLTELEWQEREEDHAIDMRRAEPDATWFTFDYDFQERDGKVVIILDERFSDETEETENESQDPDDWTAAFFAAMAYEGPCRGDR